MNNLFSINSCRTRGFGRLLKKDEWLTCNTNQLINPLFLKEVLENIQDSLDDSKVMFKKWPRDAAGNYEKWNEGGFIYKDNTKELPEIVPFKNNPKPDLFCIEINSAKWNPNASALDFKEFDSKIKKILNLCGNVPIVWITSANIKFTDQHIKDLNIPDKFNQNRLKSRVLVDEYLYSSLPKDSIIVDSSKVLSDLNSEQALSKSNGEWGTHHYTNNAIKLVRQEIYNKILLIKK
jgi:hypothetical protein